MSTTPTSLEPRGSVQPDTSGSKRRRGAAGAGGRPIKKAWIVENDEGRGEIVWADTRGKARYLGSAQLDVTYAEVTSCRRYPKLDGGVPDGLTLTQWLLANGWHWECQQCNRVCYGPEEGDPEDARTVIDAKDNVFCSQRCLDQHTEKWAFEHAIDEAAAEDFRRLNPDKELDLTGYRQLGVYHNVYGAWAYVKGGGTELVWEFSGPREDYYERRRILRELEEDRARRKMRQ